MKYLIMLVCVFLAPAIFNQMAKRWLGEYEGLSNSSKWQQKDNRNLRL